MALEKVYRVWVCYGYNYGSPLDESVTPTIISEYLFGDFTSSILADQKIREFIDQFKFKQPNKQIPQFKMIEHIINGAGQDIFFQNSENPRSEDAPEVSSNITTNIP